MGTLLHANDRFLHNLLNVLVQNANKMRLQQQQKTKVKKCKKANREQWASMTNEANALRTLQGSKSN
jgi:hypothetical protein